ncbi:MAG: murein transglycosylase A [Limnobacter sp.]
MNGNALAKRKATPTGLLEACRKARQNLSGNALLPAQIWMEANFDVWQFQQEDGKKEGLLTGYFEPLLKGSRKAQGAFNAPLYGVPADLITVKLDDIYPELKGKRLRGRLQGNTLVPFFDRAEWERLGPDREQPIVWVDDKLDAFLLQVQGSGRVTLPDGSVIRLSYAEQNGHPYKSIGKVLVDRGELTAAQATIPGIRNWAKANPGKLDELLNANPSVVFFKENKVLRPQEGPVGAMGVPLTGKLSLAIDREKVPYGSPIWIESSNPVTNTPIAQGTLAQDTGGAIRGRVRADYFWGTGEEAGTAAGLTRQPLKMWLIWPKGTPLPESGS